MFQKKGIPRNSAELTGKQLCAGVSFITMKVQASWIKSNFTFKFYTAQVLSSEICEIFKNTFENTNNSVEHLRTGARVKCYLSVVDFVIISYHGHVRDFVK